MITDSRQSSDDVEANGGKRLMTLRIGMLAGYARLGLDRLIAFPSLWGLEPEVLDRFADDCPAAGVSLDGETEGEARIASAEQA